MRGLPKPEPHPTDLRYPTHRERIREALLAAQGGWCAYSERRLLPLDAVEIEHLDDRLKNTVQDGWTNWYGVLRQLNLLKLDPERRDIRAGDPAFLRSRWFQAPGELQKRVRYVKGEFVFEARDVADEDATALLSYLCVNDVDVVNERRSHVAFLRDLAETAPALLAKHPNYQHFPTAVALELGLPDPEGRDLSGWL